MPKRNIGLEILEGLREMKAHNVGQRVLRTHKFTRPAPPQKIRAKLKISQAAFAGLMGVSFCPQCKIGNKGAANQADLLKPCCASLSNTPKFSRNWCKPLNRLALTG